MEVIACRDSNPRHSHYFIGNLSLLTWQGFKSQVEAVAYNVHDCIIYILVMVFHYFLTTEM